MDAKISMSSKKYVERARLAAEKAIPIRAMQKPKRVIPTIAEYNLSDMGVDEASRLEWALTNRFGSYCCSTVIGLNTRCYHGLLVPSFSGLRRMVLLQDLSETIESAGKVTSLGVSERAKGVLEPDGSRFFKRFKLHPNSVSFEYEIAGVSITKSLSMLYDENALLTSYYVNNTEDSNTILKVHPIVNARENDKISAGGHFEHSIKTISEKGVEFKTDDAYLFLYSDGGIYSKEPLMWRDDIHHRLDQTTESNIGMGHYTFQVEPHDSATFFLMALGYENEEAAARVFGDLIGRGFNKLMERSKNVILGSDMMSLLTTSDSFVVDFMGKKAVVAGYPNYGMRTRDALISLPGLTLINGRVDDGRRILEYLLNNVKVGRVPSAVVTGMPVYDDIDSSLWCIDRIYEYILYAGPDEGKAFLHTYWWTIKDIIKAISSLERDGMLKTDTETWMGARNSPVELQGLWYNALKTVEDIAQLGAYDMSELGIAGLLGRFEDNFKEKYMTNDYLADSLGVLDFRPNQVIPLSLRHCPVDDKYAIRILDQVETRLLTSYGLRTLDPANERYDPDAAESPFNGAVYPWLFGPYIKAYTKFFGLNAKMAFKKILDAFFSLTVKSDGISSVSEYYTGVKKYRAGGCPYYAMSVAEPLRAYFEDIMGKRPDSF